MSEATGSGLSQRWSKVLAIGLPVVAVLLAIIAVNVIGSVLIARDLRDNYASLLDEAEAVEPAEEGQEQSADPAADSASQAPEDRPEVDVELTLGEFWIEADVEEVPAFAEVTFHVTNEGEAAHDAAVGDAGTTMLEPGDSDSFTVEAGGSGVLELTCTVPGHESGGMSLELPIAGEAEPAQTASAESEPEEAAQAASPENADAYDGERPEIVRRDPAAPERPDGDVVEVDLTVTEEVAQVAPDVWQEVWTFDGQVPAPVIRAKVGDTVRITVEVPEDAQVPHSIDFHSSQTAWNNQMVDIAPGDELVYEFEATHAGVFMYHCGTSPTLHHIGNGMYGAMIVEPADGLDEVDHEMVFVQSEFYLGPQGEPDDLD